jgi:hypothetical protein
MKTIKRYFLSIHYGGAESLVKPNDCKLKEDYPQFFESVNNNSASKKELSKLYNFLENELNNMKKKLGLSKQEYVNRIKNNESFSESYSDEDIFNKNSFNRDSSSQYPFSKSSSNSD